MDVGSGVVWVVEVAGGVASQVVGRVDKDSSADAVSLPVKVKAPNAGSEMVIGKSAAVDTQRVWEF